VEQDQGGESEDREQVGHGLSVAGAGPQAGGTRLCARAGVDEVGRHTAGLCIGRGE
jgi:hypothetical protein